MPQWERGRTADFYNVGLSSWTLGFESHHTCKSAPPDPSNSLMLPKEEDCFTESKSVLSVVKKEKKESHLLCNSKALQNHSQWSKPY